MYKPAVENGLALVIVLWVISLMTIMAGSFALSMRRETTVISAVKDNAITAAIAEAGIAMTQQKLLLKDETQRWLADGSIYKLKYQDAEIRVRVLSETGKIDINYADEVLLTSMMSVTSVDLDKQQALTSAIMDWRDKDELVRINGAEKGEYEDADLAYQPANNNFQLPGELLMVLGLDNEIYAQLQPLVTVYSGQKNVDLKLASQEVLQAISGIEPGMLDQYIIQRTESNQQQLPKPELPLGINTQSKTSSSTKQVYTIISQARLNGEVGVGIKVTIKKVGKVFEILDWQQNYQELSLFSDKFEPLLVVK